MVRQVNLFDMFWAYLANAVTPTALPPTDAFSASLSNVLTVGAPPMESMTATANVPVRSASTYIVVAFSMVSGHVTSSLRSSHLWSMKFAAQCWSNLPSISQ